MNAPTRRGMLVAGAGIAAWIMVSPSGYAAEVDLAAAVTAYTGGAPVRTGRIVLDVATLVENGNTVPVTIKVDSPMTATDFVRAIVIFNEKNPQRDVVRFTLGPRAGRAEVHTRIRLATSQKLVAIAQMSDGSFWSHTVDVIVTLAACIEGEDGT